MDPCPFAAAIREGGGARFIAAEGERSTAPSLDDALSLSLATASALPEAVALFVGPEGGFTPDEIDAARAHGLVPVSLGPLVLRAETAALAALVLAAAAWRAATAGP